ncbi:MAG: adenosine deaminase, partial [Zoogloea sp.]|nr:adenosine deaminase [Zoogloea sp.]
NVRLCVFPEMARHSLPVLLAAGAKVTLNSDDPAYFGGYLNANIRAVQAAFGFNAATWYRLARNSFEASFATDDEKAGWIARLDRYFAAAGAPQLA